MVRNKTNKIQKSPPKIISVNVNPNTLQIPPSSIDQSNYTCSVDQSVANKENCYGVGFSKNSYAENIMALHDIRRSAYNSKTFFDVPFYPKH